MNGWRKNTIVFVCIAAIVFTAIPKSISGDNTVNLSGRWVSLQYGTMTFTQNGNAFTAKWSNVTASGTITGNQATFRYWSGSSYAACSDNAKGRGSITVTNNGNSLQGQWANASKKEPESGSFSATRLSSVMESVNVNVDETGAESEEAKIEADTEESSASAGVPQSSTIVLPYNPGDAGWFIFRTPAPIVWPDINEILKLFAEQSEENVEKPTEEREQLNMLYKLIDIIRNVLIDIREDAQTIIINMK